MLICYREVTVKQNAQTNDILEQQKTSIQIQLRNYSIRVGSGVMVLTVAM